MSAISIGPSAKEEKTLTHPRIFGLGRLERGYFVHTRQLDDQSWLTLGNLLVDVLLHQAYETRSLERATLAKKTKEDFKWQNECLISQKLLFEVSQSRWIETK